MIGVNARLVGALSDMAGAGLLGSQNEGILVPDDGLAGLTPYYDIRPDAESNFGLTGSPSLIESYTFGGETLTWLLNKFQLDRTTSIGGVTQNSIRQTGTGNPRLGMTTGGLQSPNAPHTIAVVIEGRQTPTALRTIAMLGQFNGTALGNSLIGVQSGLFWGGGVNNGSVTIPYASGPQLLCMAWDGTNKYLEFNGDLQVTTPLSAHNIGPGLSIDFHTVSNMAWEGNLFRAVFFRSALSRVDRVKLCRGLLAYHHVPATVPDVKVIGDSRIRGYLSAAPLTLSPPPRMQFWLQSRYGLNMTFLNLGVDGDTVAQMRARVDPQATNRYSPRRVEYWIHAGIYNSAATQTADQVIADIILMANKAKEWGAKFIVCTDPPQKDGVTNATIDGHRAWVINRAVQDGHAVKAIDLSATNRGNLARAAVHPDDGVHFDDTGNDEYGQYLADGVYQYHTGGS